ncbi:MAG: LVIVD repeat-containing protein, partial [Stenotrophobium sp.]
VTEWEEPQAVIGSYLQRYAYPDDYKAHLSHSGELQNAYGHDTGDAVGCLQLRGEYLYVAQGHKGMQIYDVASIANKGFSERIVTAPFSPLGHDTRIRSADASCVALPTNQPINPLRNQGELMRVVNQEQPFHPIYHYALITDRQEGLILTNVDTLQDGDPRNNFLTRALTWNEGGILKGARHLTVAGNWVYVSADAGVVVLDLGDPLHPKKVSVIPLHGVRATQVQFRYLFAATADGLQVVDITHPDRPKILPEATIAFRNAQRVYVARTYAYVAAGAEGLGIVDVENPEHPKLLTTYTAGGRISDARDVIIGSTNASLFAYVADGKNGLQVLQLTAPDTQPKFYGFSPEPKPELIAHYKTAEPALALSRGLDRDRAVDESGGQIAVFGRIGSRPFNEQEMQQFYLDKNGRPWKVSNDAPGG